MYALSQAPPGKRVKVITFRGGRGLHARLLAMGMIPGTSITVLSQSMMGLHVIAHNGCRLAIGRGMAHKIMVADL